MKIIILVIIIIGIVLMKKLNKDSKENLPPKINAETSQNKEENQNTQKEVFSLNIREKNAYIKLTELCVIEPNRSKIVDFLNNVKNYSEDDNDTNLGNFVSFLDENEIHFILYLDWKEGVETFHWRIESALKDNFDTVLDLPKEENYPDNIIAIDDDYKIFKDYDNVLRANGFQIGFINVDADAYYLIVHKIQDKKDIEKYVNEIGYGYYDK